MFLVQCFVNNFPGDTTLLLRYESLKLKKVKTQKMLRLTECLCKDSFITLDRDLLKRVKIF